jgi:hypothetical protein
MADAGPVKPEISGLTEPDSPGINVYLVTHLKPKEEPFMRLLSEMILAIAVLAGGAAGTVFLEEDFEGGTIPAGWTVVDGNGDGFMFDVGTTDDLGYYEPMNFGTAYAYYSDDDAGEAPASTPPEELVTPWVHITGFMEVELVFSYGFYLWWMWPDCSIEIRANFDGTGDVVLFTDTTANMGYMEIDLGPYLPADSVRFSFQYWDEGGWNYAVGFDNIAVRETFDPEDHVLFRVFDFNESEHGFFSFVPLPDPDGYPWGPNDWEWGQPTYWRGPQAGELTCDSVPLSRCWVTKLDTSYSWSSCSRLLSPPVLLPEEYTSIVLEVCHWYDTEDLYAGGNVVVFSPPEPHDSTPAVDPIHPMSGRFYDAGCYTYPCLVGDESGFTGDSIYCWNQSYFDLSDFIGDSIRFGFDFGASSGSIYHPGWYIKWTRLWGDQEFVEICGDANGDSQVLTSDGFYLLNYFGAGPEPMSCWCANVNGDDVLTTSDGFWLLNYFGDPIQFPLNCAPCELR